MSWNKDAVKQVVDRGDIVWYYGARVSQPAAQNLPSCRCGHWLQDSWLRALAHGEGAGVDPWFSLRGRWDGVGLSRERFRDRRADRMALRLKRIRSGYCLAGLGARPATAGSGSGEAASMATHSGDWWIPRAGAGGSAARRDVVERPEISVTMRLRCLAHSAEEDRRGLRGVYGCASLWRRRAMKVIWRRHMAVCTAHAMEGLESVARVAAAMVDDGDVCQRIVTKRAMASPYSKPTHKKGQVAGKRQLPDVNHEPYIPDEEDSRPPGRAHPLSHAGCEPVDADSRSAGTRSTW